MLLEITDSFWINIDKILFIVKDKSTDKWRLYVDPDIHKGHLMLSETDMGKLQEVLLQQRMMPFSPSTCL